MKAPITSFNGWVLGKITQFMSEKEGFNVETVEYTAEGARTVIQDAFGFRYEVHIKTLSRLHDSPQQSFPGTEA
jgi:hypothetical protein